MTAADLLNAAAAALALLGAAPWRLLLAVAIFVAVAEGLMFIPRAGFVLKQCVAALLAVQVLAMLRVAALGEPPPLAILLDTSWLAPSTMLVLWLCALVPFGLGMAALAIRRSSGIGFFFGNVLRDRPPAPRDFLVAKVAMTLAGAPFTFVAPAVVLKGYIGWNALEQGLLAALLYWPAPLALLVLSLAFEALCAGLQKALPKKLALPLTMALLLCFALFLFAYTYTLSAKAFGI
jgi:hypothetical protein